MSSMYYVNSTKKEHICIEHKNIQQLQSLKSSQMTKARTATVKSGKCLSIPMDKVLPSHHNLQGERRRKLEEHMDYLYKQYGTNKHVRIAEILASST